jgi:hypothetical protein
MFAADAGVDLRAGEADVPHEFLHDAQVRARFEQVGGETVAQDVRRAG